MKILFLNEYAPPHSVSGAEHSMMALLTALSKRKNINVFLLSPSLGTSRPGLEVSQLKFPFPKKIKPGQTLSPIWFNNPIFWLWTAFFIIKAIRVRKIDLIHVHGKYIQPAAIIASFITKIPVITTVRDFKFLCPLALCFTNQQKKCSLNYYIQNEIPQYQKNYHQINQFKLIIVKFWQYILKWFLNQSNSVIAVSPQLKDIYQQAGIKKTISIYNLPPKPVKPLKRNKKTIISTGKLSYGKGTDSIIKAANKLPQYQFILAGKKNISFKDSFPSNVNYLGKISHQKALNLLKKADVFLINSRWPEPLSRAGLEALSASLAVIASNRGGNQELIKNNGFLVNPDNSTQIAKKIKMLLTSDKLVNYQHNSLKLIKTRFNRQKIINQHLKLYQSIA